MKNLQKEVGCMSRFSMSKSAITKIQVAIIGIIIVVAGVAGGYYYMTLQKPAKKTLRVFEWGGYENPKLWNVGESAFKKMYPDVDVEFSFFVDESEALSKLKLGFRPDIVHPCGSSVKRYYDAGVIEPLDPTLIPNWENMSDPLKHYAEVEETPVEGKVYFAPCDWGYSTVMYRPDLLVQLGVPEDEWDTYGLLFNPKLEGKVMPMDSAIEVTPMAALAAGVPKDHVWNMNETEMAMTREKLLYQKLNLVRGYWSVPAQIVSAMASGEIAAANIWGESFVTLKSMGVNVTFSFPEEGIISWICGFCIVDGLEERDPELYEIAHAYINAWMSPEGGANLIDLYAYGPSNKYAHTLAQRTDTIELLQLDDPLVLEETTFWQYTPNEADWVAMWDEVKADPPRELNYEWYKFFDVGDPKTGKLGEWYQIRGEHGVVRDSYPMVFWNEPGSAGDIWFYAPARLKVTGRYLTELNMSDTNPKPQFVPLFAPDADSGGNVKLSFYLQYLTTEEWPATDGWIVKWTGKIELDKAAAKRVLGITDANYADIDAWWETNKDSIESDWMDWLVDEATVENDIYNMYMYVYSPSHVSLNCSKVGDLVVVDVEVVDWGGEALWAKWFSDSFMPVEYWYEDMYFNATITPYHANVDLDTGVAYALYALDYGEYPVWSFEAVLGDALASSPAHNVSDFDLYVDPDTGEYWKSPYESYGPGNKWYGEANLTISYTPAGWDLKEGEQLILKFPSGDLGLIPAYMHDGDLHYGSTFCENVTEIWGYGLDYVYIEPYNFLEFYNTTWENITEIAVNNWYTTWIYEPWGYWPPVNCSWVYLEYLDVYFHIDNVTEVEDEYCDFHIDELYNYTTDDWLDSVILSPPGLEYIEGIEYIETTSSGPSSVSYDPVEGILNLTGPLDLFGERWWWGFPEYGCPYIELYYTEATRSDDVAITSVTPSQTSVTAGDSIQISVVATNKGNMAETFNVTAYYDTTAIGTQTAAGLYAGKSRTLTFTWDTADVDAGNYTISAEVTSVVEGETSTTDNSKESASKVKVAAQPFQIPVEVIIAIAAIIVIVAIGYAVMRRKKTA